MNSEELKSKVKKYAPNLLYKYIYIAYAYFSFYVLKKTFSISLLNFKQSFFKKISLGTISFDLKINPNNGTIDKEIYVRGIWEPEILEEISKHISADSICLDVGANIGQHSIYMAKVATEGKVYAFEPLSRLATQMLESVKKNSITNIEVLPFGLSNTNEKKDLYLDNLNIGRTTFDIRAEASSKEMSETKIFDEYWQDRGPVDFIKMDVEGYEYYALKGMEKLLSKYHPILIFEFSPIFYKKMGLSSKSIIEYIYELGYKVYDLENNKKEVRAEQLDSFLEILPIQTNLLCIA